MVVSNPHVKPDIVPKNELAASSFKLPASVKFTVWLATTEAANSTVPVPPMSMRPVPAAGASAVLKKSLPPVTSTCGAVSAPATVVVPAICVNAFPPVTSRSEKLPIVTVPELVAAPFTARLAMWLALPATLMVPALPSRAAVTVVGALRRKLPMLRLVLLLSAPPIDRLLPPSPKPVSRFSTPALAKSPVTVSVPPGSWTCNVAVLMPIVIE